MFARYIADNNLIITGECFFFSYTDNVLRVICVQLFRTLLYTIAAIVFLRYIFIVVHCFNLFVDGYH